MRILWINFVKFGLPVLAAVMVIVAITFVTLRGASQGVEQPPREPPSNPYAHSVAGAGIVEPRSENIKVAAPVPDVVEQVHVQVNDRVEKGDPLFTLDTRLLRAELEVREAALAGARAKLARLKNHPRPERVPIAEAVVDQAEADLKSARDSYARSAALLNTEAVTEEEVTALQSAVNAAKAALSKAKADLDLLQAGAWKYEIQLAEAEVQQAEADVQRVKTQLARRRVSAPIDGAILRVELESGEFVGAPSGDPLIVMGDTDVLHVRVNIDEYDIPRFDRNAPAKAVPRGQTDAAYALSFVRVEPFVIPKRSLTGRTTERVDTRVLQVIYAVDDPDASLYVGQQVDVYIDVSDTGDDT